jgi:hypothetical protein
MQLIDSAIARTKQTNKRRLPPIALAKALQEESYSKERLRVSNWIMQGLYNDAVQKIVKR